MLNYLEITDHDIKHGDEILVEANHTDQAYIAKKTFFDFVCESEKWLNDIEGKKIAIPCDELQYDKEREEYYQLSYRGEVVEYDEWLNRQNDLETLLRSFVFCFDVEFETVREDACFETAAQEAYDDLRRARA